MIIYKPKYKKKKLSNKDKHQNKIDRYRSIFNSSLVYLAKDYKFFLTEEEKDDLFIIVRKGLLKINSNYKKNKSCDSISANNLKLKMKGYARRRLSELIINKEKKKSLIKRELLVSKLNEELMNRNAE